MGKSHENLGNHWDAQKWYRLACAEAPGTREPWCELAMFSYMTHDWTQCLFAAERALSITDKALVYTMDPSVWTEKPHDLASIAAWHLGMKDKAIQHCKKALEFAPNDARLIGNLGMMENG